MKGRTSAHTQRNTASTTPLHDVGIVKRVLSYVGPGEWRFVAPVCSSCRDLYSAVAHLVIKRIAYFIFLRKRLHMCATDDPVQLDLFITLACHISN
jgi:hypothetical protein